jgi:glycerol-3-phosphate acyltransferase PlsX
LSTIIAVDAMGGDTFPEHNVVGSLQALNENEHLEIILVGDKSLIEDYLPKSHSRITVIHTTEYISMEESYQKVREKKNASINITSQLVGDQCAHGMVTMGNSAAAVASGVLKVKKFAGVRKPPLAIPCPHRKGISILLDAGGAVDCNEENLFQFAMLGEVYAKVIFGIDYPTIGLLSIGEEPGKGNQVTKNAYCQLVKNQKNFYGMVEGSDLFKGTVDVIVSDGFSANIALKTAEGLAETAKNMTKEEISKDWLCWIPALILKWRLSHLGKLFDNSEYGGGSVLGLNGHCTIGHGHTNSKAVCKAIEHTLRMVNLDINKQIISRLTP